MATSRRLMLVVILSTPLFYVPTPSYAMRIMHNSPHAMLITSVTRAGLLVDETTIEKWPKHLPLRFYRAYRDVDVFQSSCIYIKPEQQGVLKSLCLFVGFDKQSQTLKFIDISPWRTLRVDFLPDGKFKVLGAMEQSSMTLYFQNCGICHESGAASAPTVRDKAAWSTRLSKGRARLLDSTKQGLSAMPPAPLSMTDKDIAAALDYLITRIAK